MHKTVWICHLLYIRVFLKERGRLDMLSEMFQ